MMTHYDVIVVGAGIEGSSIAYSVAKTGKKVLLLEQFPLPHTRGSSHGQTRLVHNFHDHEVLRKMNADSVPMWITLEKECKEDIFVNCGLLGLCFEDTNLWKRLISYMQAGNNRFEIIRPEDFRSRYPMFKVKEKFGAILDYGGGILRANRAVQAFQTIFKSLGGTLKDRSPVTSIVPGRKVKVETANAVYTAGSVVIAAGPWSGRFTTTLGINAPSLPRKALVFYWKVANEENASLYQHSNLPVFKDDTNEDDRHNIYGFPIFEYPGLLKISLDSSPPCDPDSRDQADFKWVEENMRQAIKRTFHGLEDKPSITEHCVITVTPDWMPYIDRHPLHSNILFAFGFSGMGFKFAPAVGKIVSDMVSSSEPCYNLDSFRLDRFNPKAKM